MEISVEELNNYANLPPESKARFLEIKAEEEKEKTAEDKKKNSPFDNWLQVNNSKDAYKAESWLIRESPIAYQVLRFLASEMDNYNAIICSFKVMQEVLGYKRTSLSNAVALLKEHKYLDVKKSGASNVYLINKELYWKSYGKNHKYAEFGAKIILAQSEQEDTVKTKATKHKTATLNKKGKVKTTTQTTVVATPDEKKTEKFTVEDLEKNVTTTDPEVQNNAEAMDTIQMVKDHYLYEDLSDALAKLA